MSRNTEKVVNKVSISIAVAGLLLAGFIGFLLLSNYTSLQKLRASSLRQNQFEFEQRALDLVHLLNDRNHSIQELAASDGVSRYFENKALGMSMEYGLRSSIRNISIELTHFIETSSHGDKTLFTQLAFYDRTGNKIANSISNIETKNNLDFSWEEVEDLAEGFYLHGSNGGSVEGMMYILPYSFKKTIEGRFILIVNVDTLISEYSRDGHSTLFTGISYPEEKFIAISSSQEPNDGSGKQWVIPEHDIPKLKKSFEQQEDVVLFLHELGQNGYKLIEIASAKTVLGKTSPRTLLLALGLIGLIILVTSILLVKASVRNLTLQARIDESHKREKAIELKNRQLENEIDERKHAEKLKSKLESKLRQSQKMETIGLLAGGVAHDLNNILSGLVSYPELLLNQLPEDSQLQRPLNRIRQSGLKAAAIVQDLLSLARRGVTIAKVINLNDIIEDYISSPEQKNKMQSSPYTKVNCDLAANLYNINGSPVHISKVIMNLIVNSLEAMPNGGIITITTQNITFDLPPEKHAYFKVGPYACVTIMDQGTGISPDDIEHIFEPFYTTKKMGQSGTGLGMAVVWGSVKDHNGYIEIDSEEGAGTSVTLYFPATEKEIIEGEEIPHVSELTGKGESILVVDDAKEQLLITKEILEQLNYVVHALSSGEDALVFLKKNSVDLVVLDMIMDPGIDGCETYQRILEIHPEQKALIVSGYSASRRVNEALHLGPAYYLSKPYTLVRIGSMAKKLLAE